MRARSICASVTVPFLRATSDPDCSSSAIGTSSVGPAERITARSIRLASRDPAPSLFVRGRAAGAPNSPLGEHARELGLQLGGIPAVFVEEGRPAVGHLEPPQPLANRACEGAPLVTEELALEKIRRDRSTIQLDERSLAP